MFWLRCFVFNASLRSDAELEPGVEEPSVGDDSSEVSNSGWIPIFQLFFATKRDKELV
jgi:hypothetical protein